MIDAKPGRGFGKAVALARRYSSMTKEQAAFSLLLDGEFIEGMERENVYPSIFSIQILSEIVNLDTIMVADRIRCELI